MEYIKAVFYALTLLVLSTVNAICTGLMYHFVTRLLYVYKHELQMESRTEIFYELEGVVVTGLIFCLTIIVIHDIIQGFLDILGEK